MIDIAIAASSRLESMAGDVFQFIGTIADYESLAGVPRSIPAAYVLPLAEQAGGNEQVSPGTLQRHRCTLAVIVYARHAGDAGGGRSLSALHDLRSAVQAALVGWTPGSTADSSCKPMVFVAGELMDAAGGITVWRDEFEVERYVHRQ